MKSLSETFHLPITELDHAISGLFTSQRTTGSSIQFFDDTGNRDAENVIVELLFKDVDSKKAELRSGPKCNRTTFRKVLSKIKEEVEQSTPSVGRSIIFTEVPIGGCFRYLNEFQISPPPADAPMPKSILGLPPHPMLLEFSFEKSLNEVINNYRIMKKTFELSSLLNLFLNRRVWMREWTLRKGWVYCDDDRVTKLCTLIYGYKFSQHDKYSNFKEIKEYKPLPSVNPSDYFHPANSLIYRGDGLKVPSSLNELLDKAYGLRKDNSAKLLNAAKSFLIASKLWDTSETAAYLATVNAIESIVPPSRKGRCQTCNQPLERLTKSFKTFMNKYTYEYDDERIKEVKEKIYKTRSKIAHSCLLFGKDSLPYWSQPFEVRHEVEGHILRCLCREAIINWFNDNRG